MEQPKEYPVADVEFHSAMMVVVVALRMLLRLKKALPNLHQEGVPVPEHGVRCLRVSGPLSVGKEGRRRPAVDHLKRRRPERRVERRVAAVLRPWKPVHP